MSKYKHVFGPAGYHQYQITVLGEQCRSGCGYKTAEEAALACDTLKWYLRDYGLFTHASTWSLDGEHFCTLAYRHNVPLTNRPALLKSFPLRVQEFLDRHYIALEALRYAKPDRKPWEVARIDAVRLGRSDILEWCNTAELAQADQDAFASINQPHFDSLLRGAGKSMTQAINALSFALTVVSKQPNNEKLAARAAALRLAIARQEEELRLLTELADKLKLETQTVEREVERLVLLRPRF